MFRALRIDCMILVMDTHRTFVQTPRVSPKASYALWVIMTC